MPQQLLQILALTLAVPWKKVSHFFDTHPCAVPITKHLHFFLVVVVLVEVVDFVVEVVVVVLVVVIVVVELVVVVLVAVVVVVVELDVVVVVVELDVVVVVVELDVVVVVELDVVVVVVVELDVVVVVEVELVVVLVAVAVVVEVEVVVVVVVVEVEVLVVISSTFSSLNCKSICSLIISFKVWSTLRLISFISLAVNLFSSSLTTEQIFLTSASIRFARLISSRAMEIKSKLIASS